MVEEAPQDAQNEPTETKAPAPAKVTATKLADLSLSQLQRVRSLGAAEAVELDTAKGRAVALRVRPLWFAIVTTDASLREAVTVIRDQCDAEQLKSSRHSLGALAKEAVKRGPKARARK